MDNKDIQALYQANADTSHVAGLRGVYDAGFFAGAGRVVQGASKDDDASITQTKPATIHKIKDPK